MLNVLYFLKHLMTTYKQLLAQREALDKKIADARDVEISAAIAKARELIAQYGLNESDVYSKKARRAGKPNGAVAPKYHDPATGATWTGRGKPPLWIAGQDRAQFAI